MHERAQEHDLSALVSPSGSNNVFALGEAALLSFDVVRVVPLGPPAVRIVVIEAYIDAANRTVIEAYIDAANRTGWRQFAAVQLGEVTRTTYMKHRAGPVDDTPPVSHRMLMESGWRVRRVNTRTEPLFNDPTKGGQLVPADQPTDPSRFRTWVVCHWATADDEAQLESHGQQAIRTLLDRRARGVLTLGSGVHWPVMQVAPAAATPDSSDRVMRRLQNDAFIEDLVQKQRMAAAAGELHAQARNRLPQPPRGVDAP